MHTKEAIILNKPSALFSDLMERVRIEEGQPRNERQFATVLGEIEALEAWVKKNKIKNSWTLAEKLAFLRNVESNIRTAAAVRRTELAWVAFLIGLVAMVVGFMFGQAL